MRLRERLLRPWVKATIWSVWGMITALAIIGMIICTLLWLVGGFYSVALPGSGLAEITASTGMISTRDSISASTDTAADRDTIRLTGTARPTPTPTDSSLSGTDSSGQAEGPGETETPGLGDGEEVDTGEPATVTTIASPPPLPTHTHTPIPPTPTNTATGTPIPPPSPTSTASLPAITPTDTPTTTPTSTPTPDPGSPTATSTLNVIFVRSSATATRPVVLPTLTARATLTTTPTSTPVPPVVTNITPPSSAPNLPRGVLTLLSPLSLDVATYGLTFFEWEWVGDRLAPTYGFEVSVWLEGEARAGVHNAVRDNQGGGDLEKIGENRYRLTVSNIRYAAGVKGRTGTYLWTVGIVQVNPNYVDYGLEANPAQLRYEATNSQEN